MAMQRKLWSINGLSAELNIDRRTLARDLQDLMPEQVKRVGTREEKRWLMADVLAHLDLGRESSGRRGRGSAGRRPTEAEMEASLNSILAECLFPGILSSRFFDPLIKNGCQEDIGLTAKQARKVYGLVVIALSFSFADVLGDEDLKFSYPPHTLELLKQVGDESRAANTTTRN